VTKRAIAHEEAEVKWIDCNIGSRLTMKYPGVVLKGRKARGEVDAQVVVRPLARPDADTNVHRRARVIDRHRERLGVNGRDGRSVVDHHAVRRHGGGRRVVVRLAHDDVGVDAREQSARGRLEQRAEDVGDVVA